MYTRWSYWKMLIKEGWCQQDDRIGGSPLVSPQSNNNLASIHGQKCLCVSIEIQVRGYETWQSPRLQRDTLRRWVHALVANLMTMILATDTEIASFPYGLSYISVWPWLCLQFHPQRDPGGVMHAYATGNRLKLILWGQNTLISNKMGHYKKRISLLNIYAKILNKI